MTTRLPKVGEFVRSVGRLVSIQDAKPVPPPVPEHDYIFEEITARGELRLNGECIKQFSTYNDFYGEETSVRESIKDMAKYAADRQIGPESELEAVVVHITSQERHRPGTRENLRDKTFIAFDPLNAGSRWNLPEPIETVVWSSKSSQLSGDKP